MTPFKLHPTKRGLSRVLLSWVIFSAAATAQTILNMSEDLVRLGIATSNVVRNQPDLDAGPLLFRAVVYAQKHQIARVIADPGAYYFLSLQQANAHVSWAQLSNLTIDFQGSDLYFSHPLVNGIYVTRSTNITLQNFTSDYNPLPFTQVSVVSVNASTRQIQFAVNGDWQNPAALNPIFAVAPNNGLEVHIFRNGRSVPGIPRMFAANPLGTNQFTIAPDPGNFVTSAVIGQIRPGDIAFLGMRTQRSGPVASLYCTGCTFRNIVAYSSAEWGISVGFPESCIFDHTYSMPRPGTDRLASTYGQIEIAASGPGNQIRFNRMIRTMDNSIVYGVDVLGTVQSQINSRSFVLQGALTSLLQFGGTMPNGSTVSFQKPSDGTILGSAVIVSQVTPPFTGQPYEATFNFDRDLPATIVGAVVFGTDAAQHGSNAIFERNALESETDCCRGFLIAGSADTAVRGNYIQGAPMAALHFENALYPAFLSPPSSNLTISNNVIDHTNWTPTAFADFQLGSIEVVTDAPNGKPATGTAHQDISITNNFISDSGTAAVWMGNTNGGSVSGNYFLTPNDNAAVETRESSFGPQQALVVESSNNIAQGSNVTDQTSARMWITDVQYRELAAYAPGSTVRLNAYGLGTFFSVPAISITDADGNVAPVPIRATTAHSIDVQVPNSVALGGAYVTLASGNFKYFGTLFLDNQDNSPALNGCTYELSPSSTSLGASGGSLPILVLTQPGCAYQVTAADAFVTIGGGSTGTGVVSVVFAANLGSARNSTIEIAGQPITFAQAAPSSAGPAIQAVFDSWNYTSGIAPGGWASITGTGLAPDPPRTWNLSGVQQLPTTLGGVTVTFNGRPASVLYVSPTQVNVLVPSAVVAGPVRVIVQSNGTSSPPFTVTAKAAAPAIYALPTADGSTFFVTAALAGTATLIGNSATDPRVLRAAQPGDILDLYMIGLGVTQDGSKFITDQVFSGAYSVSAAVIATIKGETAPVLFAGLTSPGLYLVRIQVPADIPPGPQAIQVSSGGSKTRSSLVLTIGPAP